MSKFAVLLFLLSVSAVARAQNPPSAVGAGATLWVGGEVSSFNPDYSCSSSVPFRCYDQLIGPAVFFDLNMHSRWGMEGEARWMDWHGEGGQSESNYLLGPRYRLFQHQRLSGWGKFMLGGGWTTTDFYPQPGSVKGSYFVYSPGGTLSYDLSSHLALRADYEFQIWPSFAGPPTSTGSHNNGLTPNGFSFGVAWHLLGR